MLPNRSRGQSGPIAEPRRLVTSTRRLAASSLLLTFAMAADAPKEKVDVPAAKAEQAKPDPKADKKEPARAADQVALSNGGTTARTALKPDLSAKTTSLAPPPTIAEAPIVRAIRTMAECQARFDKVKDYTCTFYKRERIDGKLGVLHVLNMKVRNEPRSVYLKFDQPHRGREAIYVEGRNKGRVLAHDVGLNKFLAGTLELEPRSTRAMQDCRHPITEAGIGSLIRTVSDRWTAELKNSESVVLFDADMRIGSARCLLIEAIHPDRGPDYVFHKVRLFIDSELGFPIRFEGYDWPKEEGGEAELMEEYAYDDVKLNVGLVDRDFDTSNRLYSFGRF
ncbi:MAG: DUF1571 domain-containing protein [Paludisphaera borealis]|uniref:DUF1571 domain-containing protein n=1 Tax=Paludisphaera borealis TaxID=1387353 RepID=UPI0028473578|nr:DUF1571 domain-containing protein [Paludisphaera borealis]MDR3621641.1 DUF1571 domain-containing protein [Paludisphaera borealis]